MSAEASGVLTMLDYEVSYSDDCKGFQCDTYPALKAMVAEDMKAYITGAMLLAWSGDIRYARMLGLTYETVRPWSFRWFEYLESRIVNQVNAVLWLLDPDGMAEGELWI
jgi:hypothetical protein